MSYEIYCSPDAYFITEPPLSPSLFNVNMDIAIRNKKAVLPQGNRAMLQVFFSVEVRQQHSLQV